MACLTRANIYSHKIVGRNDEILYIHIHIYILKKGYKAVYVKTIILIQKKCKQSTGITK